MQDIPLKRIALVLGVTMITSYGEYKPQACEKRQTDIKAGKNDVMTCGSTTCPPSVKTTGTIGNQSDLSDGWFVYRSDTSMYWSPLKEFKPTKIPNTGKVMVERAIHISDDGKWIMYNTGTLIKRDGTGKSNFSKPADKTCFFRNGPKGAEILYSHKNNTTKLFDASAMKIKFEATSASFSDLRPVVKEDVGLHNAWLQAAGEYIVTTKRITPSVVPGLSTDYNGILIKVPDNGNGIASKSNMVNMNPAYPFSCGITISHSGKYTLANYGNAYQDCFPEGHKGFAVIPTNPPPSGDMWNWMNREGVSVNWCPAEFNGTDLRVGTNSQAEFNDWNFSNYDEWVVGVHRMTDLYGVWLVNWKTNQWTLLTTPSVKADWPAIHFDKAPAVSIGKIEAKRRQHSSVNSSWFNIQGRMVDPSQDNRPHQRIPLKSLDL